MTYTSFDNGDRETIAKDSSGDKDQRKFLKDNGGPYAERFSLSSVSPGVLSNIFPISRVIEYNIDGLSHDHPAEGVIGVPADRNEVEFHLDETSPIPEEDVSDDDFENRSPVNSQHDPSSLKKRRKVKKGKNDKDHRKQPRKTNFPIPKSPSKSPPSGPGYSVEHLSLLS
jgi:endopolyphosphatase